MSWVLEVTFFDLTYSVMAQLVDFARFKSTIPIKSFSHMPSPRTILQNFSVLEKKSSGYKNAEIQFFFAI